MARDEGRRLVRCFDLAEEEQGVIARQELEREQEGVGGKSALGGIVGAVSGEAHSTPWQRRQAGSVSKLRRPQLGHFVRPAMTPIIPRGQSFV